MHVRLQKQMFACFLQVNIINHLTMYGGNVRYLLYLVLFK